MHEETLHRDFTRAVMFRIVRQEVVYSIYRIADLRATEISDWTETSARLQAR